MLPHHDSLKLDVEAICLHRPQRYFFSGIMLSPGFYPVGWAQCLLLLVSIIFGPDAHSSAQAEEESTDSLSQGHTAIILLSLLL